MKEGIYTQIPRHGRHNTHAEPHGEREGMAWSQKMEEESMTQRLGRVFLERSK